MEPITYILGGTLVGVISVGIGKVWGANGRVKDDTCSERRTACNKSIDERLHAMDGKLDLLISRSQK